MTLADQAAITGHDGQVTSGGKPGRPKRRTFTATCKARILAAYDALPEGSPERGALLRKEREKLRGCGAGPAASGEQET